MSKASGGTTSNQDDPRTQELTEEREELDSERRNSPSAVTSSTKRKKSWKSLPKRWRSYTRKPRKTRQRRTAALTAQELVPFVIAGRGDAAELAIVNIDTVEIAGEQTVPVASREVVPYQGGLLAAHAASGRLLLLDSSSLAS